MRYAVTVRALLGLAGSTVATTLWAQAPPRPPTHLVGRVIDEHRSPVEGVEVILNRRDVRARTDSAGLFTLDVGRSDSTIGFRRIGYQPLLATVHPLPPPGDLVGSDHFGVAQQATPLRRNHEIRRRIPAAPHRPRHPHHPGGDRPES